MSCLCLFQRRRLDPEGGWRRPEIGRLGPRAAALGVSGNRGLRLAGAGGQLLGGKVSVDLLRPPVSTQRVCTLHSNHPNHDFLFGFGTALLR